MKAKFLQLFIGAIFIATTTLAQGGIVEIDAEDKFFEGTINSNLPVFMRISGTETIEGGYFYTKHRREIALNGSLEGIRLELDESVGGKVTGHFDGGYHNGEYSGSWKSPSGKSMPFSLKECSREDYQIALNKKDLNSVSDAGLRKMVSAFEVVEMPFYVKMFGEDHRITEENVNNYLRAENAKEDSYGYEDFYGGQVFFRDSYWGFTYIRYYTPGAFGINNLFYNMQTRTYEGKLISDNELGCQCDDTNMGSNDYYSTVDSIVVTKDHIFIYRTNTHATLIEDEAEEPFEEVEKSEYGNLLNESGVIDPKAN